MQLAPTLNRIIVRPKSVPKEASASGIIIAGAAKEKHELGTVVSVGPGKFHPKTGELVPMSTVVGDTVLFSRMSGEEITFGDQAVISIFEDDIIGIVRA